MHDDIVLMALIITSLVAIFTFLKQAILIFCPVRVSNGEILYSLLSVFIFKLCHFKVFDDYSRASEQRTLWELASCPLLRDCPYLGGS